MPSTREALLLLGGNVGEVADTFARAEALIGERAGPILSRSRDHRTEPWGFSDARLFLNRALTVGTALEPEELMDVLIGIEAELGRTRTPGARYAPRAIDIDILLIDGLVTDSPSLTVPHPRMLERAFVLEPAADIAPGWVHAPAGLTVLQSLLRLAPSEPG